jgi:quinol monooxygenase YgiN
MFARILEFSAKMEKKDEIVKVVKNEILPILKKQNGFLEVLPLFPETRNDKIVAISLWNEKKDIEKYDREVFPEVAKMLKPYLTAPIAIRPYTVVTKL